MSLTAIFINLHQKRILTTLFSILGEPGVALMIVEESREATSRRFALLPEPLRIKTNQQLSIETFDKAMRSSCKGSSRYADSIIVPNLVVLACVVQLYSGTFT